MFSKEEIKNLISIVHEYSCLSCKKLLDDYPRLKNFSSVDSFDQLLTSLNYELDKKEYYEEEDRKLLQQLKNLPLRERIEILRSAMKQKQ